MSDWFLLIVAGLPLLALWLYAAVEVVRRRDLSGARTVMWLAALFLVPVVGLAVYVVARPPRAVGSGQGGANFAAAEALVDAAECRQRGDTTDAEYRAEIVAMNMPR